MFHLEFLKTLSTGAMKLNKESVGVLLEAKILCKALLLSRDSMQIFQISESGA